MSSKDILKVIILLSIVHLAENLSFPISPGSVAYGNHTKSVSLTWELEEGVSVIVAKWVYTTPDVTIAEYQNGSQALINQEYKDRVNVTVTDRLFQIKFYDLQFTDEGEIECDVTLKNFTSYKGTTMLEIITPLNVTISPTNDSMISEYSSIKFECVAYSRPISSITWYRDSTKLLNNGAYNITEMKTSGDVSKIDSQVEIKSVRRNDVGNYRCFVQYPHATESKSAKLFVYYGAVITSFPPEEYGTIEGASNVNIPCIVSSNPAASINWYINDVLYQNESPKLYAITNNTKIDPITKNAEIRSIFHLINVTKENLAKYTCEAVNVVPGRGEQKTNQSTTLVISHKPYFLQRPPPILVSNTSTVVLNCTVQGFPSPSVWWTTNNTKLDPGRIRNTTKVEKATGKSIVNTVLEISGVRRSDSGRYQCVAVSGNETVMTETYLKVSYAPIIAGLAPVITVEERQIQFLECQATAYPSPKVKWFFAEDRINYTEITSRAEVLVQPSVDYSFNISSKIIFGNEGITRKHSGNYFCQAMNAEGNLQSHTNVTVEFQPEVTLTGPAAVKSNETAVFECVVDSNPESVVKWFKSSVEIQAFSKEIAVRNVSFIRKTEKFTIQRVELTDMGVYKCEATNSVLGSKKVVQKEIDFKVRYKPQLKESNATKKVMIQSLLTLSCAADAYPPVNQYAWFKNGQDLSINQEKLIFPSVDLSVEGNYTCTPKNDEGFGPAIQYVIQVIVKPTLKSEPNCTKINNGQVLRCECDAVGVPMPNITWKVDATNQIISNQSIVLIPLNNNTEVNYTCHLMNIHGSLTVLYDISKYISANSEWTQWSSCDKACAGQQSKSRSCHFKTCEPKLTETKSCNLQCPSASPVKDDEWHKDWYIAFWVMIPLLLILLIILFVWCGKKRASQKKAVFVPKERENSSAVSIRVENATTFQTGDSQNKQMPTQREIYLPDRVQMTAVNNGYVPDRPPIPKEEPSPKETPKKLETDTIEVEMQFQEEIEDPPPRRAESPPPRRAESPPQRPKLDPVDAIVEFEDEGDAKGMHGLSNENYEDDEEEPDISFPASTFNHLNSPTGNASFMGLYESVNGPPKPPRKQDTSFKGGNSAYATASLF